MSFVTFMGSHWPTLALSVAAAALSAFVLLVSGRDLGDSDAFVDDPPLPVNLTRLRATLEKIGSTGYLTTHRGRGYSV